MLILLCAAVALCNGLGFVGPIVRRMSIPSWAWRVWSLNIVHPVIALGIAAGWRWTAAADVSLLHLSDHSSLFAAGTIGYLAYTSVFYWWHRARHSSGRPWRLHANGRTPRWVALLVQRPGIRRLHHEADRHEGNYGDLPLWEYLFGTLRRPDGAAVQCGFTPEREERLIAMLRGVDVHAKERERTAAAARTGQRSNRGAP